MTHFMKGYANFLKSIENCLEIENLIKEEKSHVWQKFMAGVLQNYTVISQEGVCLQKNLLYMVELSCLSWG